MIVGCKFWPQLSLLLLGLAASVAFGEEPLRKQAAEKFGLLESVPAEKLEAPEVKLGHSLFWDKRLSRDGKTACASCHLVEDWAADRRQFSPDAKGKLTTRNSQTVFNAVLQPTIRWAGDRKSGAQQAEKSLTGSMGFASADDVIPLLKEYGYEKTFQKAYPQEAMPMSPANYGRAIEAYEATLVTPAPFDRYLAGDDEALDAKQRAGLKLFISTGCADCHQGKLLGGESFEKFGIVDDYWKGTKSKERDTGRFEVTKVESDRYVFRVAMLRNITKTAPYFHDGSVKTIAEAVKVMAAVQLEKDLNDDDTNAIVAFLNSLTGDVPKNYKDP